MDENGLQIANDTKLDEMLQEADYIVLKRYMDQITQYSVKEPDNELKSRDANSYVRLNKIEKIVYDVEENNQDKLMNVYNAVALCGGSVINVLLSDGKTTEYYLGTKSADKNNIAICQSVLKGTFEGNFPGSELLLQRKTEFYQCIDRAFTAPEGRQRSISFVSGVPGLRNKENKKNEMFVQGIEKVIDSMKGQKYALVIISDPISPLQIRRIEEGYEDLYTQLSAFVGTSLSYSVSDSSAVARSITDSMTKTIGDSITSTVTNSTGGSEGLTESRTHGVSIQPFGIGFSANQSDTKSTTKTYQHGISQGETQSSSFADSRSTGITDTYTNTTGRILQINIENKKIKDLLEKIDAQLKRIRDASDLGLWNTAAYCIGEDTQTGRSLANAVEAICRGEETSIESFSVGTWEDRYSSEKVIGYLKKLMHPVLEVDLKERALELNPTSLINGKELAVEAGLPQKSVTGVPVSGMVPFARNIVTGLSGEEEKIRLGRIYHMGKVEDTPVSLGLQSLSSHTLITGSTGSGKSNTVYQLISELDRTGIRFLVIEPAKGEYKNIMGNRKDVHVYGTNGNIAELLRINPFSFPPSIHVLEHVDRLIEIFNVCWPMYAAMPAVLKDALLQSYENCGWDMEYSKCRYTPVVYPGFKDLLRELKEVVDRSEYSEEVKGNYTGSLSTRVRSLTNGLNGQIFTDNAVSDKELFDTNVIIDLSRVGSSETKSLIMGLLVIKLNEYRMDQSQNRMNQKLSHITVLEEAHNLLRNTNISGNAEEGGNVAGKSVEMISNSIAEMRTYGEGFIIVDQSPGAIDISAIRNTNTKIIMRLPEESDRQQAGKSAALKKEQIDEIAKLGRGVAVVYQNDWLDPVLCRIDKAAVSEEPYRYDGSETNWSRDYTPLLEVLFASRIDEKVDADLDDVEQLAAEVLVSAKSRLLIREALEEIRKGKEPELCRPDSFEVLCDVTVDILGCSDHMSKYACFGENCSLLQQALNRDIERRAEKASQELRLAISQCMIRQMVVQDNTKIDLYEKWREFALAQRKVV